MFKSKRKTYKGKLQFSGESASRIKKGDFRYSELCIGQEVLRDIDVSSYYQALLKDGSDVELTLTRANSYLLILAIVGIGMYFLGDEFDSTELFIAGIVFFIVCAYWWVLSLIEANRRIYSVKVNGRVYRDYAGVQYKTLSDLPAGVPAQSSLQSEPVVTQVVMPDQIAVGHDAHDDAGSFNPHILGVSKLVCPKCSSEALVVPETKMICGTCREWMQLDLA